MVGIGNRVVPSLLARNLRETLDFYANRLGFRVTGHYPTQDEPSWAEVSRDGVVIQFFSNAPQGVPTEPVLSGTLYFFPESVSALADEWSDKIEYEWGPEVMDHGMREFGIRDPNGYFLAFTEPA